MSQIPFLPLILFCLIASGTPGPNNMINLAQGVRLGFVRALPFAIGTGLGLAVLLAVVALGLGAAFQALPGLRLAMKALTAGFLIYLAWKLVTAGPLGEGSAETGLGFGAGVLFQWINPKSWFAVLSIATTYLPPQPGLAQALAGGAVLGLVSQLTQPVWIGFGTGAAPVSGGPAAGRGRSTGPWRCCCWRRRCRCCSGWPVNPCRALTLLRPKSRNRFFSMRWIGVRPRTPAGTGLRGWPVSRILSGGRPPWMTIPLRRRLPGGSSCQPGPLGRSRPAAVLANLWRGAPIRHCSRWGLPCRPGCPVRGGLLPHRFTLARCIGQGRSLLCGAFPGVAPAGRYPAPLLRGVRTFLEGCPRGHPAIRAVPL